MSPAGTGELRVLVALGVAAVQVGHKVRYFTGAELVEAFFRPLADNSVGQVIDPLLRNDLIICDELGLAQLGRHRCLPAVSFVPRLRTPLPGSIGPSNPGAGSYLDTPPLRRSMWCPRRRRHRHADWSTPATKTLTDAQHGRRARPPVRHCSLWSG